MQQKYTNIIINGFHDTRFDDFLSEFVKKLEVEKCYYLSDDKEKTINGCTTVVPDLVNITFGQYERSIDTLLPLDHSLLSQLQECEVLCLRMMDRIEHSCTLSYGERKRIYLNHVRYWNTVIEEDGISLFIANNMPHEIYDFIIYSLCKIKHIKTFFFHQSLTIPDSIFLISDIKESTVDIQHEYQKLLVNNSVIQLEQAYKDYLKQQTSSGANPTPFYMKSSAGKYVTLIHSLKKILCKIIKSFVDGSFFNKVKQFFSTSNRDKRKRKKQLTFQSKKLHHQYSDFCISKPDLKASYVYVPLHYQPELTTCPLAEEYVDQLLAVHLLSKCIPKGTLLYVKEHPKQTSLGRDTLFYQQLMKISSVRFISKSFSSYELMNNSAAVATCTGTAGWEALFRQKPVLMFGSFFYQYADGVYRVRTLDECMKACSEIFSGKKPDMHKTTLFLQAVQNCTIRAVCDPVYWTISTISVEESNKNMFYALIKKLI